MESRSSEKPQALPARMLEVKVENFAFTPSSITARKGEPVTLRLIGVTGAHGFYIPDLGLNVPIAAGQTVDVTLPTGRPGTYRIICSLYCGSGHGDMTGTLVITE
jgi:cytochrome c oxidase subunit 2